MQCHGKYDYNKENIFDFELLNDENVKIFRDDFSINITKEMFKENFDIVN